MSTWHKRALANAVLWGVATIGFLVYALAGDGPAGLLHGTERRIAAAVFLAGGILASLVARFMTRVKKDTSATMIDERDRTIARKAAEGAFAVTAIFVFILCIALDDHYQEIGSVPVGWVWFVAYASWLLAYLSQALLSLVLYAGIGARDGTLGAEG